MFFPPRQTRPLGRAVCLVLALLLAATPAWATPNIQQKPVQFKKGETGATIKSRIQGDQIIDYQLHASAGQALAVKFTPSNLSAYFNVLPPGSEEALFVGSSAGNEFSADLKLAGVYTIRVYLMRNAARRNESTRYTLDVSLFGSAARLAGISGPSKWDASGEVKCSAGTDRLDRQCAFRVVRNLSERAADIWVGKVANGEAGYRYFHYENRIFTTSDRSKLAWQRKDDNWWVSVDGKAFYQIPDALIHGG